jgi:hypothetical protein
MIIMIIQRLLRLLIVHLGLTITIILISVSWASSGNFSFFEGREKSLASFSVDDVVVLFRQLNLPNDCEAIIRDKKVDGRKLRELHSIGDIKYLELPLSNLKSEILLSYLDEIRLAAGEHASVSPPVDKGKYFTFTEKELVAFARLYGKRNIQMSLQVNVERS